MAIPQRRRDVTPGSGTQAVGDQIQQPLGLFRAGRAQTALAWSRANPVVVAPQVGANLDEAVALLDIVLTDDEIAQLERPYTPRHDFQGISGDAELQRIAARIPQLTVSR
jgi:aryl-alcohol dehydrogenase-like predicted oxidoreductase